MLGLQIGWIGSGGSGCVDGMIWDYCGMTAACGMAADCIA